MKDKGKKHKKPLSIIAIIAFIVILIIARNIDITNIGNLEFGFKKVTYIIILLLSISAIAHIV